MIDRLKRLPVLVRRTCLDLNKHNALSIQCNNVNFAERVTVLSIQNSIALLFQKMHSRIFSLISQQQPE